MNALTREDIFKEGFDEGFAKGLKQGFNLAEENTLKFYYCESLDKYLVGKRCDTRYYAEVMIYPSDEVCLCYGMSRFLPWSEKGFPSEPVEISFEKWLEHLIKKFKKDGFPEEKAITV